MALGALIEAVVTTVAEFVVEVLVRGAGYGFLSVVARIGGRRIVDPDSIPVLITGVILWALLGTAVCVLWKTLSV